MTNQQINQLTNPQLAVGSWQKSNYNKLPNYNELLLNYVLQHKLLVNDARREQMTQNTKQRTTNTKQRTQNNKHQRPAGKWNWRFAWMDTDDNR